MGDFEKEMSRAVGFALVISGLLTVSSLVGLVLWIVL